VSGAGREAAVRPRLRVRVVASGAGAVVLSPISVRDVLIRTFRLHLRHFRSFAAAMAVCTVPGTVLSGVGSALVDPQVSSASQMLGWVCSLASVLVSAIGGAAAVQLSADAIVGGPIDVELAYRRAIARVRPVAWVTVVFLLMIMLSITIIGIPFAVYRLVGWSVSLPAIVIEGRGGRDALTRSSRLVGGQRWPVLGTQVVILAVTAVPALVLGWWLPGVVEATAGGTVFGNLPAWARADWLFSQLAGVVVGSLLGALSWISIAILYFQLRGREDPLAEAPARIEGGHREQPPATLAIELAPDELARLVEAVESEETLAEQPTAPTVGNRPDAAPPPRPDLARRLINGASNRDGSCFIVSLSWEDWDAGLDLLDEAIGRQPTPAPELLSARAKIENALISQSHGGHSHPSRDFLLIGLIALVAGSGLLMYLPLAIQGSGLLAARASVGLMGLLAALLLWLRPRHGWYLATAWALIQIPVVAWGLEGSPTAQSFSFELFFFSSGPTDQSGFFKVGVNLVGVIFMGWLARRRPRLQPPGSRTVEARADRAR
jgi:hypothetical protein